jgi:hypothetical protein
MTHDIDRPLFAPIIDNFIIITTNRTGEPVGTVLILPILVFCLALVGLAHHYILTHLRPPLSENLGLSMLAPLVLVC